MPASQNVHCFMKLMKRNYMTNMYNDARRKKKKRNKHTAVTKKFLIILPTRVQ